MRRLLLGLSLTAALLALLVGWLDSQRHTERSGNGLLRPLPRHSDKAPSRLEIRSGTQTWVYVRADSLWRYPARFNAFVLPEPINYLIDGLLRGPATTLSKNAQTRQRCGLDKKPSLLLKLSDNHGNTVQQVAVGQGLPGPGGAEACVRPVGAETLFQLHANPRLALAGDPPMVDPFVLPRGLSRWDIAQIDFGADAPLRKLERIQLGIAMPQPGQPPQGPTYRWLARTAAGRADTCNDASVYAFTSYLSRLRYQRLENPQGDFAFGAANTLRLIDANGRADTLEVGRATAAGHIYLRHRNSGLVYALAADKAALLFPTAAILVDSLAAPSPYQSAEPERPSPQSPRR